MTTDSQGSLGLKEHVCPSVDCPEQLLSDRSSENKEQVEQNNTPDPIHHLIYTPALYISVPYIPLSPLCSESGQHISTNLRWGEVGPVLRKRYVTYV